jgi:multiple sugar transport system substrate-binding protein
MTILTGMTWDHPRGIDALRAASELFARETSIRVDWTARPLSEFEDTPIAELAQGFDLIALDHPFIGDAVNDGALRALDESWSVEQLRDRANDAAGLSQKSYEWHGASYAAAVDAACMVSAARASALGIDSLPRRWTEVSELSSELGRDRVLMSANPTHLWGTFLSLCENVAPSATRQQDGRPLWWTDEGIDAAVAVHALELLHDLLALCSPESTRLDPIAVLERLAGGGDELYAPLIFGYVTYARSGSRLDVLRFSDAPSRDGRPVGTLTGGVGLAVSAHSTASEHAAHFVRFATSHAVQAGTYVDAGGQSGRRSVWLDERVNAIDNQFYAATLQTMDRSFLRPRGPGYPQFQRSGSHALHELVLGGASAPTIIATLDRLWRAHVRP